MFNREQITNLAIAVLATYFLITSLPVVAEQSTWTWTVPAGVTKIKVVSERGDNTVLSTTFNVVPGQTFNVEAVQ